MRCATSSPMYGDPEASHRMRNELSLWLKWLVIPVQCSRVFLTWGQNERGESSSSRQGQAHAPRPPWFSELCTQVLSFVPELAQETERDHFFAGPNSFEHRSSRGRNAREVMGQRACAGEQLTLLLSSEYLSLQSRTKHERHCT